MFSFHCEHTRAFAWYEKTPGRYPFLHDNDTGRSRKVRILRIQTHDRETQTRTTNADLPFSQNSHACRNATTQQKRPAKNANNSFLLTMIDANSGLHVQNDVPNDLRTSKTTMNSHRRAPNNP